VPEALVGLVGQVALTGNVLRTLTLTLLQLAYAVGVRLTPALRMLLRAFGTASLVPTGPRMPRTFGHGSMLVAPFGRG
jgi:hypothetical protein